LIATPPLVLSLLIARAAVGTGIPRDSVDFEATTAEVVVVVAIELDSSEERSGGRDAEVSSFSSSTLLPPTAIGTAVVVVVVAEVVGVIVGMGTGGSTDAAASCAASASAAINLKGLPGASLGKESQKSPEPVPRDVRYKYWKIGRGDLIDGFASDSFHALANAFASSLLDAARDKVLGKDLCSCSGSGGIGAKWRIATEISSTIASSCAAFHRSCASNVNASAQLTPGTRLHRYRSTKSTVAVPSMTSHTPSVPKTKKESRGVRVYADKVGSHVTPTPCA
jgi:hypothetical protein